MRDFLSRLRAVLSPAALLAVACLMLLVALMSASRDRSSLTLEERASRTLSAMEGAGRVEVTIRTREVLVSGGSFGAERKQEIPCGAIAVAQGADDPLVEMQLREALCALLGVSPASVSIAVGGWK